MKTYQQHFEKDYAGKRWIATGMAFGLILYVFTILVLPLILSDRSITWQSALVGLPLCAAAGLAYGFTMKIFMRFMARKETEK
ncbi:MAG: hypothetical protein KF852_12300 [Saprospiraceae bacterium]|nr:hypothetical protein [Saprospiraceae bacterium]